MRSILAGFLVLATAALASAQTSWTGLAPIGLPLPPIGLPLAPMGLPASMEPIASDQGPGRPGGRDRGRHGRGHRFKKPIGSGAVYIGPPYYWWDYEPPATSAQPGTIVYESPVEVYGSAVQSARPPVGRLRLEVEPAEVLQVFIDGEFVGTMDEVGSDLDLGEGSRRIELRAPGYEPLVLDVRIVAGRTITYRNSLTREPGGPGDTAREKGATSASAGASPANRTLYFIPGCYLGNVPPQDVTLPEGCDLSRLITRTPE
jgi:hypothetical protein